MFSLLALEYKKINNQFFLEKTEFWILKWKSIYPKSQQFWKKEMLFHSLSLFIWVVSPKQRHVCSHKDVCKSVIRCIRFLVILNSNHACRVTFALVSQKICCLQNAFRMVQVWFTSGYVSGTFWSQFSCRVGVLS